MTNATSELTTEQPSMVPSPAIVMLSVEDLQPDPEQGRKHFDAGALEGLARSLRESGVLEPLLVKLIDGTGKHQIVDGERRWRASKLAGITVLPCIVRVGSGWALDQLVANFQREDLNAVEKAVQLRRTMAETGMEAKEVAQRAGLSHQVVLRYLRLGDGPEVLRAAVRAGMRVTVDGIEKTRRLEFEHALEALRIHTAVFEPADKSPQKRRALARLDALIRRALTEGWTRNRWRSHLAALTGERHKGSRPQRSAAPTPDGLPQSSAEPESAGEGLANAAAAADTLEADGRKSALEVDTPTHSQALDLLDRTLSDSSREDLLAVAERLEAVQARIARDVEPAALFSRSDGRLVVYLDRLDGRPVDAFQRSALIKQAEAVLSAARRAVAA